MAHGQSARFRLVKYAILIPLFAAVYWKFGGKVFAITLVALAILGSAMHFFFRWKTNGWRNDRWLYKRLEASDK